MATFLFVTSWQDIEIAARQRLASNLEDKGHTVHLFLPSSTASIADNNLKGNIYQPPGNGDSGLPSSEEIETEYGIPSLRHLYLTEQEYFALSQSEARRRTRRLAAVLEEVFAQTDPDCVFQGRGGEIHRLLAYYMIREAGGSHIWGEFSPFDGRIAFSTRLEGTWDAYETVPDRQIPDRERAKTDQYVESFLNDRRVYEYNNPSDQKEESETRITTDLLGTVTGAVDSLLRDSPNNVYRFGLRAFRQRAFRLINDQITPSITTSRRLCRDRRYVFFPLQYPSESRLTVFSPEFHDQTFLLEYLERILPEGVDLFVKQHPNHPGDQPPLWLSRFSRRKNAEFLNPSFNAHEAIENAETVVVTNNTVGFEALFHSVPLVVVGRAFYGDVTAATTVRDLSMLPQVIDECVQETVPKAAIRESIHSLYKATYPGGEIHSAVASGDDGGIETIGDSLIAFAEEYAQETFSNAVETNNK